MKKELSKKELKRQEKEKNDFGKILGQIKQDSIDPNKTREYIKIIQQLIESEFQKIKEEDIVSKQEIFGSIIKEFEDRKNFGDIEDIIAGYMLNYRAYKALMECYEKEPDRFKMIIKNAKLMENMNGRKDQLNVSQNLNSSMYGIIRDLLRRKPGIGINKTIYTLTDIRDHIMHEIKNSSIDIIQERIAFLEQYGCLDRYIAEANNILETNGIPSELNYKKRNPVSEEFANEEKAFNDIDESKLTEGFHLAPDKLPDWSKLSDEDLKNKKFMTDIEDIGVLDSFEKEYLSQYSPEDLILILSFWESKYFQERLEFSKAFSVIKTLNIEDSVLSGNPYKIEEIEDGKLKVALEKDAFLTYLYNNKIDISSVLENKYRKFLRKNNIDLNDSLKNDYDNILPELESLNESAISSASLESIFLLLLQSGDIQIGDWGVVSREEDDEKGNKLIFALEHKGFRGPLVIGMYEDVIQKIWEKDVEFPEYSHPEKIDTVYSDIMTKLFIPRTENFTNIAIQAYKNNKDSKILEIMAGDTKGNNLDER